MTRADMIEQKMKNTNEAGIEIVADNPKAVAQVEAVLTELEAEYETSKKGKSTIFEVEANLDIIQKLRDTNWVMGVSLS